MFMQNQYNKVITFLRWSFGYCGSPLHFVDDNVLVYSCGNTLTFVGSDGKHIYSCVSEGTGAGCLTVCQKAGLLAYCETILEPKIFILSYPSCGVQVVLEGMQAKVTLCPGHPIPPMFFSVAMLGPPN